MKKQLTKFERFLCSWWFFAILIAAQFVLLPFASRGFDPQLSGVIIRTTLGSALTFGLMEYAPVWQALTWVAIILLLIMKNRFARPFTVFVGISYLLYAVVQNVAVTEGFGVSIVTSNIVTMGFTAFVWLRDAFKGQTDWSFRNLKPCNGWLLAVALLCLWWPLSMETLKPDFNPAYLLTSGSAIAFCPMTPVFLILMILCKPAVSLTTYRVTAMAGTLIGLWNMGNFGNPATFWLGAYHLPLMLVSLYALVDSWRLKRKYYV